MDHATGAASLAQRFSCLAVPPSRRVPSLKEDVCEGLLEPPRTLPPKYFYDDRGSRLFDRICDTPEYYPTRTEAALLAENAGELMALAAPDALVEFGSGTSRKTRHLLEACEAARRAPDYWPFDVCEEMLREAGRELMGEYGWLQVRALVGDYLAGLEHLPLPGGRRCFVFLGGTIGNFEPAQARWFLGQLRAHMRPGDSLVLGADRVKDPAVLRSAYNDAEGITAEFNLNVLRVLNRELAADFDPEAFTHRADYNERLAQIEMYLIAEDEQRVAFGELETQLHIRPGEKILTEISRKFTPEGLEALLAEAGLLVEAHFEPDNAFFSLVYATPV